MSRERLENLVCIDKCAEKNGTYEMPGRCSNCYREYVLVIPKGHPAPGSFSGWRCVNCGCSRVGADHRKPAEPLPAPEGTEEQAVIEAAWTERVEHGEEYALVVEMGARGDYWWVLCPASATLITDVPKIEDDPTNPDDHEACSISPECDFFELHVLAHAAIRRRAALARSTPATPSTDEEGRA